MTLRAINRITDYSWRMMPLDITLLITSIPICVFSDNQRFPVATLVIANHDGPIRKYANNTLLFNEIRTLERQVNSASGNRARQLRLRIMALKQQLKLLEE